MQMKSSMVLCFGLLLVFSILNVGIVSADNINIEVVDNFGGGMFTVATSSSYAYVGQGQDLVVLNTSDPSSPVEVGRLVTPSLIRDIAIEDNYAYVADYENGLVIVDINIPSSPVIRGTYDTSEAYGIAVKNGYAYLADFLDGLIILDVQNPDAPTFIGKYDADGYDETSDVAVKDNYVYIVNWGMGIKIFDITNPSSPSLVSSYDTEGYEHSIHVEDDYAYVADGSNGLVILDITDPTVPVLAGSYDTGDAWSVDVSDNYAYVPNMDNSLVILNITDPSSITVASSYDTGDECPWDIVISGNYAYIADVYDGLSIVDITNIHSPTFEGQYETACAATTDFVIEDNYAYVADYANGLVILNISNPESPILAGSYDIDCVASGVVVKNDFAYVAAGNGLTILNVSTPSSPILVSNLDTFNFPVGIDIADNYAYVLGWQGLVIVDVNNPIAPQVTGSYSNIGHVSEFVNDVVFVEDEYVYITDSHNGLVILNVSDPSNPTLANIYETTYLEGVFVENGYAYIVDEDGLSILDISIPSSPILKSSCDIVGDKDVFVDNNYAFVTTDCNDGLVILNVTNPSSPEFAGRYDNIDNPINVLVNDDYIYISREVMGLLILHIDIQNAASVTLTVDDDGTADYSSIQAAIDAANSEDIILVKPGTYNENVDVYKQLTITSTGGASITTVNAVSGNDHVFDVTADWVNISGINACGATASGKAGIYVGDGISHASVSNCVASNNYYGIYLNHSNSNILKENTPSKNSMHGIRLAYSNNNTLLNNTASSDNACATLLYASSDNTIMNNDFSNSFHGLFMYVSSNSNLVSDNTGSSNDQGGIYLEGNNNTITGNTISNNGDFEIRLINSSGNLLYHNNFDGNNNNAHDDGNNQWDSGIEGNYYSDYTGTDSDSDGIGDTLYQISGGSSVDRYPLMEPYSSPHPVNTPPTTNPVSVTNTESLTPTVVWTYNDCEGNPQQQYQLEVWTEPSGLGINKWSTTQSSIYTSMTYAGHSLIGGHTYYVRVRAFDGSNWGEWSETSFVPYRELISEVEKKIAKMEDSDPMKYYDAKEASSYMNTIGILKKEEYDAYIRNIGIYRGLQSEMLQYALLQAKEGKTEEVERDLNLADLYGKNADISFQNACNLYSSVLNNGIFVAKKTQTASLIAFKIVGTAYGLNPQALLYVEMAVTVYDGIIIEGKTVEEAGFDVARDAFFESLINHKFPGLEDNSLAECLSNSEFWRGHTSKEIYLSLSTALKSDDAATILFSELQKQSPEVTQDVATEMLEQITNQIDKQLNSEFTYQEISIKSPGELRVYDSGGNLTGLINGEIVKNIPNSIYDTESKSVIILGAGDTYRYEIVGTGTGEYGLDLLSIKGTDYSIVSLRNTVIPNEVHQYTVDWENVSTEKTVTLKVDSNGDGIFDQNILMQLPTASFTDTRLTNSRSLFDGSSSEGDIVSYKWDFGDGTNDSGKIVDHIYVEELDYAVTLTVENENGGIDSKTRFIRIDLTPPLTTINISGNLRDEKWYTFDVQVNLSATDIINGTGINKTEYSFDNATWNTYYVPFNISNKGITSLYYHSTDNAGNVEPIKNVTIKIGNEEQDIIPPLAITNLTSTSAPTCINFTWSNPTDSDFNHTEVYLDGIFQTITSEEHFNATGLQPDTDYTISTRTVDIYGNVNQTWVNLTAKTKSLDDGTLKVDFTANTTCGEAPLTVLFSGNSSNALKWSWDIDGDGNEDGNTKNLIYTYTNSGIYNVSLTVTNAGKIATETKYDYIAVNDPSDVILSITDYTEKVLLDSDLTYEITMENTKNVELTNVQLVDVLPSELIFVSSSGATFDESTNTVIFDIDNLMPEESIIFKITVKTAAYGQIENSVTMYCDQLEPISSKDLTTVVTQEEIPEFPTIMIPVLSVIGLAFLLMRRRE